VSFPKRDRAGIAKACDELRAIGFTEDHALATGVVWSGRERERAGHLWVRAHRSLRSGRGHRSTAAFVIRHEHRERGLIALLVEPAQQFGSGVVAAADWSDDWSSRKSATIEAFGMVAGGYLIMSARAGMADLFLGLSGVELAKARDPVRRWGGGCVATGRASRRRPPQYETNPPGP
jgi:hypothetical protein